jgi:endonuclease YncB( thermonuclease family)
MNTKDKKRIYSIIITIFLIAFSIYTKGHEIAPPKEQVSSAATSSAIPIDKSVKVEEGKPVKVARIVDGDTLVLINGEELRYIGIDTPEEFDPRKPVQCYAVEAAERNRQLVEGKTIIFYKDVNKYDKYGRWLGYIYLEDGTFVNEVLVNEGFAFSYPYSPDTSKTEIMTAAERHARLNNLGLWSACKVTTLSTGRRQTNPVK